MRLIVIKSQHKMPIQLAFTWTDTWLVIALAVQALFSQNSRLLLTIPIAPRRHYATQVPSRAKKRGEEGAPDWRGEHPWVPAELLHHSSNDTERRGYTRPHASLGIQNPQTHPSLSFSHIVGESSTVLRWHLPDRTPRRRLRHLLTSICLGGHFVGESFGGERACPCPCPYLCGGSAHIVQPPLCCSGAERTWARAERRP